MADPKSQRIEELEKQLEEQKDINAANLEVIWNWERKASEYEQKIDSLQEQCSTRYEAIEKLYTEKKELQDRYEETAAHRDALVEDNNRLICEKNKLMEKLDAAEGKLERAKKRLELEINEKARVDRLYDEIKIKNANICSTIAEMVRKIMIE